MDLPSDEVKRIAKTLRLLSLCSGPDKEQGLDKFVQQWGAQIDSFDVEISPTHNLLDEGVWEAIIRDVDDGKYHGGAAVPCNYYYFII